MKRRDEETYISVVRTGLGDFSKDIIVILNGILVDIMTFRRSKTLEVFFFFHIHHIGEWGMGNVRRIQKLGLRVCGMSHRL